jgi:hypothetical protein
MEPHWLQTSAGQAYAWTIRTIALASKSQNSRGTISSQEWTSLDKTPYVNHGDNKSFEDRSKGSQNYE